MGKLTIVKAYCYGIKTTMSFEVLKVSRDANEFLHGKAFDISNERDNMLGTKNAHV